MRTRAYPDQQMSVDVSYGNALPEIGERMYCRSEMTDLVYELTIKAIRSVEWLSSEQGVRVTVRCSRRVAPDVPGLN